MSTTLAAITILTLGAGSGLTADQLSCEYLTNPLGIDVSQPRLSWQLQSDQPDTMQAAYHLLVASTRALLDADTGDLWDSGRVESDASVLVAYGGAALLSRQEVFWKVRVWDNYGRESGWSTPARWSMGLLKPEDWHGQWIGLDETLPSNQLTAGQWVWYPEGDPAVAVPPGTRYFRRSFTIDDGDDIETATCYVAVDNVADVYVNGERVQGSADFHQAARIEIGRQLHEGLNVIAIAATNHHDYANPAALLVVVELMHADGRETTFITDESWKSAQQEQSGWTTAGFDDSSWAAAHVAGPMGIEPWKTVAVETARDLPARMLRKEFETEQPVRRATAYVSGQGMFELYVNGSEIGDQVLAPAVSEYDKRVYYMTFDVTEQIQQGVNAVGAILGSGRYFAPRSTLHRHYGFPKLLLQLEIEYDNGSTDRVVSDPSWRLTTDGPIRMNNEYDGETYDARLEMPGWAAPGFADDAWQAAQAVDAPGGVLAAQMTPPIRVIETRRPQSIAEVTPGVYVVDMGQNMVGWCQLNVRGDAGTRVAMRFAEVVNDDGTLNVANLRGAKVTDTYILKGEGEEIYAPRFTFHGFRYMEITGFPGVPTLDNIVGCVVHDDLPTAGTFASSNPLLNRIHRNIVWGTRGNYRSMPTDCPQRDERQGWLGDRSEESRGETYLFQVAPLYAKWVRDTHDAQTEAGSVPDVAPSYYPFYSDNVTWPSTYIIVPGALYDQYGDRRVIEQHYDGMKRWIDYMTQFLEDDLMPRDQYGDWCVPPEDPGLIHSQDPKRKTAAAVLGTAYFYHDLMLMARYAELLDRPGDAAEFRALASKLRDAFNAKFYNPATHDYDNGSQTASILPLAFGMAPEAEREAVATALAEKIAVGTKSHVGTGLIGGQWLMRTLTDHGHADLAYTLASNTTYPSWGYMIEQGATTIWELWNGDTADPGMNSHNHVMLVGDLVLWMVEYLAGIRPDLDAPGFKQIVLKPTLVDGLDRAEATHQSLYGPIASAWSRDDDRFTWTVAIPPNTAARAYIPGGDAESVRINGEASPGGEAYIDVNGKYVMIPLGSGAYTIESKL